MNNSELQIDIVLEDSVSLIDSSEKIIDDLAKSNYLKLQDFVLENLNSLDGGPSISNLEIHNLKYNQNSNRGSFRLRFKIDRRYCCSDIESCANDYLDFDFKVQDNLLIAKTEYFDWSLNN